jgi:hypothetical protein
MNKGDESILSTETRKRKRKPGLRFSRKKDLERSRLSRSNAKAVKKVLSYPDSGGSAVLEPVEELAGVRIETNNSILVCEFSQPVRDFNDLVFMQLFDFKLCVQRWISYAALDKQCYVHFSQNDSFSGYSEC